MPATFYLTWSGVDHEILKRGRKGINMLKIMLIVDEKKGVCIPLRAYAVCILFISSEWDGIFQLNFAAQSQVSVGTFWDPYI